VLALSYSDKCLLQSCVASRLHTRLCVSRVWCHLMRVIFLFSFKLENCQFRLAKCKITQMYEKESQRAVMWDLAVSSDCLCIYIHRHCLWFFANIVPFLNDDYQNCNLEFSHLNCFYLGLLLSPVVANFESSFCFKKGFSVSYRVVMKVVCYHRVDFKQWNDRDHSPIHFFVVNGN